MVAGHHLEPCVNIILFGPPGSGKGTQAQRLVARGMQHFSTGEMLRKEITDQTDLGRDLSALIARGDLVPDLIVIKMIEQRLDTERGIVFDGFPRTVQQAQAFDALMKRANKKIDRIIDLVIPDELLMERICGRFECSNCHTGYHDKHARPVIADTCDKCGSNNFTRRPEDNPESLAIRLERYHTNTERVIAHYADREAYYRINAAFSAESVAEQIGDLL